MELKNKKINFLGDSITEGAGASEYKKSYTQIIAAKTGAICRNYGISGTRIARQTESWGSPDYDRDFCSRYDSMDPDADIIVIFGGTNDYGHGDAPLGSMSDRSDATFYGALHTLYRGVIEKYPEAKIIVLTPLHRFGDDMPSAEGAGTSVHLLKDYVHAIREVAEYYSLPVLDLFATVGIQPNVPIIMEKYTADGLHPNDRGHQIIADKIINFLEREF